MKRGFTLVEILVAISIMIVLFGLVVARFNTFNDAEKVRQAALTLKSDLRLAQTKARSGQAPTSGACTGFNGYYVNFMTTSSYTITPDCGGNQNYPSDTTTVTLPSGITFSALPSPFYYRPLTQGTSLSSDLEVQLTNGTTTVSLTVASVSGAVSE